MTVYCLARGADDSDHAIIHKLECASYDLGSLLGEGRLVSLGHFDSSALAFDSVKSSHPDAVRCEDCCRTARMMPVPFVADVRNYLVA